MSWIAARSARRAGRVLRLRRSAGISPAPAAAWPRPPGPGHRPGRGPRPAPLVRNPAGTGPADEAGVRGGGRVLVVVEQPGDGCVALLLRVKTVGEGAGVLAHKSRLTLATQETRDRGRD